MSSSFKYLDQANTTNNYEDKAQSFLDEKLAKNKHTIAQQDTGSKYDPSRYTAAQLDDLNASGGPKEFTEQQKVVTNQDEIDAFNAKEKPLGGVGDLNARYKAAFGTSAGADLQGANSASAANEIYDRIKSLESDEYWAAQDLSNLMSKAGHQETTVNIGNYSKDGGLNPNASIANGIDFSNVQSQLDEKGWNGEKNNSIGQLGSALLAAGGTGGAEEKAPEPIEEMIDIEHSPEIKQAKERVQTYENDITSGKTSDDIYNNKYKLDLNSGLYGIGTPIGASNTPAKEATESFLEGKKEDVKKKFQYKAQS
tara:strand:+ start:127 stop:1059 length:933 start_codon:yes stop_codon:yes gene_type:complete